MKPRQVKARYCIYGAGGHARELASIITDEMGDGTVAALVDDFHNGYSEQAIPVLDFERAASIFPSIPWLVAVGTPKDRRLLTEKTEARGLPIGTFVSRFAYLSRHATVQPGAQLYPHCAVSNNTRLGRGCIVNYNATISHDCVIGDWVTISPGVNIAGYVQAGDETFMGIGARVLPGKPSQRLAIGANCMIGAGATVTGTLEAGITAVGTPAQSIGQRQ